MNLLRQFRIAFTLPFLLMAFSLPVGAGTYNTEMVKMANAIAASFDQKRQIKTIAVLDFTDLQGTVTELGRFLAEELSADLVMGQKQFDVIDRANLKRLLDENKLSRSGLVDPEAIKRLGKMAGADALVTGTVTPLGNSLRVSARIINTETARIVGAAHGDIDKTPEISELLRARVLESGSSATGAVPSTPAASARAPVKKVNLTYETNLFRATIASAFFDKSANQIMLLIDFTNLKTRDPYRNKNLCLATTGSDTIFGIDEFASQWNLVRMVGIRQAAFLDHNNFNINGRDAVLARASWVQVLPGTSHRFTIILAPSKADSSLTLSLTLGLYAYEPNTMSLECFYATPDQMISIGFDGIDAVK